MKILVTGAAGFIGYHLSKKLLENSETVVGLDNLNDYYDQKLKNDRLKNLINFSETTNKNFYFFKVDLRDKESIKKIFQKFNIEYVVNLAAQAGVRYSIENPDAYIDSNIIGFMNILELSREFSIKHLIYASSSSVYGGNKKMPFSEKDNVDHPISLYAVTKRSNELMAHTYSHLFNIPSTGLRFFTVYGPWGRPDMALFLFTKAIFEEKPIKVFNNGKMMRDFTFVDDVIEGIMKIIKKIPKSKNIIDQQNSNPSNSWAPYKVLNIGNSSPTNLEDYISAIEEFVGKKAKRIMLPMQPGDVECTFADTNLLEEWVNYKPKKTIREGILSFIDWYRIYYKVNK